MADLSLDVLRPRVRRRADQVQGTGATFRSDADVDDYIQSAYKELYYYVVGRYEDMFSVDVTGTLVAGTTVSFLPSLFFKLLSVSIQPAGITGAFRPLQRITRREGLERFDSSLTGRPTHYFIQAIEQGTDPAAFPFAIIPLPTPNINYGTLVQFIKAHAPLPAAAVALRNYNPYLTAWDDYLVLAAAAKLLNDEQNPAVEQVLAEMERVRLRVEDTLTPLDTSEPAQIVDRQRPWWRHRRQDEEWWWP